MSELFKNTDYRNWFIDLKSKIQQSQIKAALAVNSRLIRLYWDLGKQIVEKQENAKWGTGFIDQLSKDLKAEFPDIGGFSSGNLRYMKIFYLFYNNEFSISEQVVRKLENMDLAKNEQLVRENKNELDLEQLANKIPWGHHILILKKIKNRFFA